MVQIHALPKAIDRNASDIVGGDRRSWPWVAGPVRAVEYADASVLCRDPRPTSRIERDMLDRIVGETTVRRLVNRPGVVVVNRKTEFGTEPFPVQTVDRDVAALVVGKRGVISVEDSKGLLRGGEQGPDQQE